MTKVSREILMTGDNVCLARPRGGNAQSYVLLRRSRGGWEDQPLSTYPGSDTGWAEAYAEFSRLEPLAAATYAIKPDAVVWLDRCTYLGGYGTTRSGGAGCVLSFMSAEMIVIRPEGEEHIRYERLDTVETSGRGRVRTGGGFFGGGFGVGAAAEGMLWAAALNSLTTRTHVETVLRIAGPDVELFFHHANLTPEPLRIALSPVIGLIGVAATRAAPASDASMVGHLAELARLKDQGVLDEKEFSIAKRRLLGIGDD